jgi:hypothetical protein
MTTSGRGPRSGDDTYDLIDDALTCWPSGAAPGSATT